MRKLLLFSLSAFFLSTFFFLSFAFASSAYVQTETSVTGSGNVTTHIETTVNGQTKTVDSSDQGEHEMTVHETDIHDQQDDGITPSLSPIPTAFLTPLATITAMPVIHETSHLTEKITKQPVTLRGVVQSFVTTLRHLFHLS